MHDREPQLSDGEHLAVVEREIDERRRAEPMHRDRHVEAMRELLRRREVIGVRMRIDQVMDAQALASRQREVAVDQADLGIDQRRGAAICAADEVRPAAAGAQLLKDHLRPRHSGTAGADAPGEAI